jgi:hypothetical protein
MRRELSGCFGILLGFLVSILILVVILLAWGVLGGFRG